MSNVMLDLETLGTDPGCVILSIGACKFDNSGVLDTFYRRIDTQSCQRIGLDIDGSTVLWWLQQEEAPRKEVCQPGADITGVLFAFSKWIEAGTKIWGNGASFDNAILSAAYRAANIPKPFRSHDERCYRTIKNQYPEIKIERMGTLHNALDDAISQAHHLIRMIKI